MLPETWRISMQAYKNYITTLLNRKNTITGVYYRDDPIIFALELANEPTRQTTMRRTQAFSLARLSMPGSTT